MESKPQNPEFRINPENFHPCYSCFMWPVKSVIRLDRCPDLSESSLGSQSCHTQVHMINILALQTSVKRFFFSNDRAVKSLNLNTNYFIYDSMCTLITKREVMMYLLNGER